MNWKRLYEKYKDVVLYLFFGVCTTVANVITYWLAAHPFNLGTMPSAIIAWVVAVTFAYITNRKWVFHSSASGGKEIFAELTSFFACRLATGGVDWGCMLLFVDIMGMNDMLVKCAANIIVIVLNYVASKLVIFQSKGKKAVREEK